MYVFPWWQSPEWRDLIIPYLDAIGVDETKVREVNPFTNDAQCDNHQIVRCLLARMPGGSTIPVHHDTGYWVPRTHRVHVPIITSEKVVFRVGKTPSQLMRYSFNEGR